MTSLIVTKLYTRSHLFTELVIYISIFGQEYPCTEHYYKWSQWFFYQIQKFQGRSTRVQQSVGQCLLICCSWCFEMKYNEVWSFMPGAPLRHHWVPPNTCPLTLLHTLLFLKPLATKSRDSGSLIAQSPLTQNATPPHPYPHTLSQ